MRRRHHKIPTPMPSEPLAQMQASILFAFPMPTAVMTDVSSTPNTGPSELSRLPPQLFLVAFCHSQDTADPMLSPPPPSDFSSSFRTLSSFQNEGIIFPGVFLHGVLRTGTRQLFVHLDRGRAAAARKDVGKRRSERDGFRVKDEPVLHRAENAGQKGRLRPSVSARLFSQMLHKGGRFAVQPSVERAAHDRLSRFGVVLFHGLRKHTAVIAAGRENEGIDQLEDFPLASAINHAELCREQIWEELLAGFLEESYRPSRASR
jgi:hypothetical protein